MRLNELIESQASSVFLNTDHFAEEVTHRPLGDDARDSAVIANVVWNPATEDSEGGKGTKLAGQIDVPGTLCCNVTDKWVVAGTLYQTLAVGEPQGGLRTITVQRTTIQLRGKVRQVM